jgi:hypothetical protein
VSTLGMNPCTEVSTHGVSSRSDAAVVGCYRRDAAVDVVLTTVLLSLVLLQLKMLPLLLLLTLSELQQL